jgi:hypothetical protein
VNPGGYEGELALVQQSYWLEAGKTTLTFDPVNAFKDNELEKISLGSLEVQAFSEGWFGQQKQNIKIFQSGKGYVDSIKIDFELRDRVIEGFDEAEVIDGFTLSKKIVDLADTSIDIGDILDGAFKSSAISKLAGIVTNLTGIVFDYGPIIIKYEEGVSSIDPKASAEVRASIFYDKFRDAYAEIMDNLAQTALAGAAGAAVPFAYGLVLGLATGAAVAATPAVLVGAAVTGFAAGIAYDFWPGNAVKEHAAKQFSEVHSRSGFIEFYKKYISETIVDPLTLDLNGTGGNVLISTEN